MRGTNAPLIVAAFGLLFLLAGLQRHTVPAATADPDPQTPEAAYRMVCGRCHPPHSPRLHTRAEWPAVVEDMRNRADHRGMPFAEKHIELAIQHLQAHGR